MNSAFGPADTNAFAGAVDWLGSLLTGTLASLIAIIAIASMGFLFMSGRVDLRRSAQVVLGCFIIFGASTIAAGIVNGMRGSGNASVQPVPPPPPIYPTAVAHSSSPSSPYDPYAGAALPPRR